jgi:hypothetical protein
MLNRVLPFVLLALAVALFVSAPALAEGEKNATSHEGTVVSCDGKTLVMKDKSGTEHTHAITTNTVLTLDGRKSDVATFKTLKAGTKIRVWTDNNDRTKVTKIDALDRNNEFGKSK